MYMLTNTDFYEYQPAGATYCLDILPLSAGLAVTSSDQKLAVFNPASLNQGPLTLVETDHGNITAATAFASQQLIVCTTGENGSVTLWDLRQAPSQARVARLQASNQAGRLSLACSPSTNTIAAGTEFANHQASILIWDVRATAAPRLEYNDVHSDDVTELNFHPSEPSLILSGSTDGLVNICDTRITDEDEVVVQTFNHDASIHHAGFLNATEVFAISHDERFALYDMAEEVEKGIATVNFGDMRQVVGGQYVADVHPKLNGAGAVIGVGAQDQQSFQLFHLSKAQTWALDQDSTVGLAGGHGSEIVRSFFVFDEQQVVYTAGEDGQIKAWRPS